MRYLKKNYPIKVTYLFSGKKFDLGLKLDIQMEFKTTRQNGIFLALSEGFGIPSLALELFNGTVCIPNYS